MRIIIAGAGKIGQALCLELANEGHDLILIELKEEIIDRLMERSDISGIKGSAVDYDVQIEAGIKDCDLFISVTGNDELNLISAILADRLGAKYTVARVSNPQYGSHMSIMRRALGVSLMINPKLEAAREIAKSLSSPSSVSVESFAHGRVNMHQVIVEPDSQFINLKLADFRQQFSSLIVCAVMRDDEVIIPDGSFVLQAGDVLQITGFTKDLDTFYRSIGKIKKPIKDILIIGGSEVTNYLCRIFQKQTHKVNVTVIEKDQGKAWQLAAEFPDIYVLKGDGTDHSVLEECNFDDYDAIIALTGVDEENIMVGLLAAQKNIRKIITKVNRTEILPIVKDNRLQTIVTPKSIVSDHLIRLVRAHQNAVGSNVEALYRIFENKAEVLEFNVRKDSKILNVPLRDLKLKNNTLIVFILRNNNVIFPTGKDCILADDHIVVVSKEKHLNDVDDILDQEFMKHKLPEIYKEIDNSLTK